jgi:hypothetical protein
MGDTEKGSFRVPGRTGGDNGKEREEKIKDTAAKSRDQN